MLSKGMSEKVAEREEKMKETIIWITWVAYIKWGRDVLFSQSQYKTSFYKLIF